VAKRLAQQPNGSWCLFSDDIMDFLVMNATKDEIRDFNGGRLPNTRPAKWETLLDLVEIKYGAKKMQTRIEWDLLNEQDSK